ncbi:MAG: hypothetical protein ABW061_22200 [Polyangiaceae bacterium]
MIRSLRLALLGTVLGFGACGGRAASESSPSTCAAGFDCEALPDASPPWSDAGTADSGAPAIARGDAGAPASAGSLSAAGRDDAGAAGARATEEAGAGGEAGEIAFGGGGTCAVAGSRFATGVVDHAFGGGQNFNQEKGFPNALFGPPVAGEPISVVSLGNGGWVILEFANDAIVDGPGVDFTVFENPLGNFQELATVAVSDDLRTWVEFPCTASQDAQDFGACAGVGVVLSSPTNGIDPLDPAVSGGDHYDLSDIHVSHARYVRITDRVDLTGLAGVFDLDAVAIVNAECR